MGTRVDSSNYDPGDSWTGGAQLVAMNFQTPDQAMRIYRGRFRDNGRSGYVLKPQHLLTPHSSSSPTSPLRVTITFISGRQIPKPQGAVKGEVIDPFVSVYITGCASDRYHGKVTSKVDDNGFNPVWNEVSETSVSYPLSYLFFQSSHFLFFYLSVCY